MKFPSTVQILSSSADEEQFISSSPTSMIFFGSNHCGHCHNMVDFYSSLPSQYPSCKFAYVETSEVNVDNIDDGVPVFVIYSHGQPIDSVLGASPDKVTSLLYHN